MVTQSGGTKLGGGMKGHRLGGGDRHGTVTGDHWVVAQGVAPEVEHV